MYGTNDREKLMSSPKLDNCIRCNRLFSRTNDLQCNECLEAEQELFKKARGLLRRSRSVGGISISDLAEQADCSAESIEGFYNNKQFGMDADLLLITCAKCTEVIQGSEADGKFCQECSESLKDEVGNETLSREELDAEAQSERDRLTRLQEGSKTHYGLSRNKGQSDRTFYKF